MRANKGFLHLRRLEAARDIAQLLASGGNRVMLDSQSLLLNGQYTRCTSCNSYSMLPQSLETISRICCRPRNKNVYTMRYSTMHTFLVICDQVTFLFYHDIPFDNSHSIWRLFNLNHMIRPDS